MFKRIILILFTTALLLVANPCLLTAEAEDEYIAYARLNDGEYTPLSQSGGSPTLIWEDSILEFSFTTQDYALNADFSLKEESAYNADPTYDGLPFSLSWDDGDIAQFKLGELNQNFPPSEVGKTLTLTVAVNGTQINYYLKAQPIQKLEDPVSDEDKEQSSDGWQNGIPVPLPTPPAKPIIQSNPVAAGNGYFLAIKADGSLWAQGSNWKGQLGTGTTADATYTPTKVMDNVVSVAACNLHSLAIKADGSLWSWGENESGLIGDGTVTTYYFDNNNEYVIIENNDKSKPVNIMNNVVAAAAGAYHCLALKADASLWAWGDNMHGQIGDGTVTTYYDGTIYAPVNIKENNNKTKPIKIMDDVVFVAAGGYCSLAIKADGSLWVWGAGVLGNGTRHSVNPVKVMDNVAFASAAGHMMAIKTDGSLWAWGENTHGQIGDGTLITLNEDGSSTDNNLWPTKIMDNVAFASAGTFHSLTIKTDGSLWAWGDNTFGQLGNGKVTIHDINNWNIIEDNNELRPIKIMDKVAFASAGHDYNIIVKEDGSLCGWGNASPLYNKHMGVPEKIMDGIKMSATVITPPATIPEPPVSIPEPPVSIPEPSGPIPEPPVPPVDTTASFSDLPTSHWAYTSIMTLVEKGAISGYPDGTFRPGAQVTRSEFAKMMYFTLGIDKTSDYSGVIVDQPFFTDMTTDNWEYMYVKYVGRYMTGFRVADGQVYFKGGEAAVREDMAVALVKALGLETEAADDINADYVYPRLQGIFSDADTISPNLRKHVLTAYEFDLFSGYPDGNFGAQKPITRAEAASLLVKVLKSEAMEKVTFY